jgi:hypothetical protein
MANGPLPPTILLEDANDLCGFLEAIGRTVPRSKWAVECLAAADRRQNAAVF